MFAMFAMQYIIYNFYKKICCNIAMFAMFAMQYFINIYYL